MEKYLLQNLCPELSYSEITKIAQESGFVKRVKKKYLPVTIYHFFAKKLSKGPSAIMT
jgi:hypothetical protein